MKKRKIPHQKRNGDTSPPCRFSIGRIAYMAFLCPTVSLMFSQPAFAATDVWTKATEIMQDVYTQILAISTIAAIVTASVALLLMNFSRSGKTVDESRAWLKRIVITWAILNSLGFIMSYIVPFFEGGQWAGYELCVSELGGLAESVSSQSLAGNSGQLRRAVVPGLHR